MCYGVVNYPFLLPSGMTASDLGRTALLVAANDPTPRFNLGALPFLPDAAHAAGVPQAIKKFACANAFRRCDPVAAAAAAAAGSEPTGLPPCAELCTPIMDATANPFRTLVVNGAATPALDCAAFPSSSAVPQQCNDMSGVPAAALEVQRSTETYPVAITGATSSPGRCASLGRINSTAEAPFVYSAAAAVLLLSSSSSVPVGVPPLPPPGVTHSVLEATISGLFQQLPGWRTEACIAATADLFCRELFMPAVDTALPALGGLALALPRFPCRSACDAFSDACRPFFTYLQRPELNQPPSVLALAAIYGNASYCGQGLPVPGLEDLVKRYPAEVDGSQAVPLVPGVPGVPLPACNATSAALGLAVPPPVDLSTATGFTSCPSPLVVPADRDYKRRLPANVTGCEFPCPLPWYTPAEYAALYQWYDILAVGGQD